MANGADSNRAALLYVQESTFGVTPATPNMKFMRFTGESLGQDTNTTASQEIRSDRQVPDLIRVGLNASGDVQYELSSYVGSNPPVGMLDDFWLALLQGSGWTGTPILNTGMASTAFVAAAGTISSTSIATISPAVQNGDWIKITGATASGGANNGYYRVISGGGGGATLTVEPKPAVDETVASGAALTQGTYAVNGTTFRSFAIERRYTDLSNEFALYNGMCIDQGTLAVTKDGIITGAFSFLGKKEASASATAASTTTAANTSDVYNAVDDVQAVLEGGVVYDITDLNLQIRNNMAARLQVGTLGAIGIRTGNFEVTGSIRSYYASKTVVDKYLAAAASKLSIVCRKAGTNGAFILDMPRIKYSNFKRVAGGINQDIIGDLSFQAILDPTSVNTMRLTRFIL